VEQTLVVQFDDDPVRFTPDGKVSVLDVIRALTQSDQPERLWESLKEEHPEILDHCEDYFFRPGQSHTVMDKEGSEMLLNLLIEYLGNAAFSWCGVGAI
jgi:hypothetical protein